MPTLGDYSSILEIGIGLNLAVSYVGTFVEPSIQRAASEITRFRWWTDAPERLTQIAGRQYDPADFEEALSEWVADADSMKRSIERHRKLPTILSLAAAFILFFGLCFPGFSIPSWTWAPLAVLALLPIGGAAYVWCRTRNERRAQRSRAKAATGLLMKSPHESSR